MFKGGPRSLGGSAAGRGGPMVMSADMRVRAAWLYYQGGQTQQEISEKLGISRSTVIKLLDEARRRGEVQIWINLPAESTLPLGHALEQAFGVEQVIVVPNAATAGQTSAAVGAALGEYLSRNIADGQTIGFGWGSTLSGALASFRAGQARGIRVLSLLGGAPENRTINPVELAWQMAGLLQAECLLFLAPLIVDSAETKRRLIELCGLNQLITAAQNMDIAVISCGAIGATETLLSRYHIPPDDQAGLIAAGATCETLCHFMTDTGESVAHPLHDRIMSVGIDAVAQARQIVLASGGVAKARAIRATIHRVGCHALITDEAAAHELLRLGPLR